MTCRRSVIIGCGAGLPERSFSNEDLVSTFGVDTSDGWIFQRTGISSRYLVGAQESTCDLAVTAARQALKEAGLKQVDMVVLATCTPNHTFPATATSIQAKLGIRSGMAFDIQAVCAGFLFGLGVVDNFLRSGQVETALVIGADTISKIIDWRDRRTCVLFGDGAGAVVLQAREGEGTTEDRGILSTHLRSDGKYYDLLYTDGGPSSTGTAGYLRMSGQEVFRYAVTFLTEIAREALKKNHLEAKNIDWFVPHQANIRIIQLLAQNLHIPMERVILTIKSHGNTSAASIPLALVQGVLDGRLKEGDLLLLEAIGGGLCWGAVVVRW